MPGTQISLKPLDFDANLRDIREWADELADASEWAGGLAEPFDDVPEFNPQTDTEVDTTARLSGDKRFVHAPIRRLFRDYRSDPEAYKHISPLPKAGESLHGVISGKYALWQLVPAIIEATGQTISDLYLCTLSYSRANAAELLGLLEEGQVKRVTLLVSYFFKAQNRGIYDALIPELLNRGHRTLAMRTHCKLMLMKLADGTCYVAESSANLRSSKNLEQFNLTCCPELYQFHRTWLEDELFKPREREAADVD